MQNDEPTLPHRIGYESDAATDPGAYSEAPTWPPPGERSPRPPLGVDRSPLLWLSLGATGVLLVGVLGLLLLSQLGVFAARGTTSPLGSFVPTSALSSPTATSPATASASTFPISGALQVDPSRVRLGCDEGELTQEVTLANTGSNDIQWQAVLDVSGDQAGIAITPNQGDLAPGASVSVQLENTTRSSASGGGGHREGVIQFAPTSAAATAGQPASVSYRLDLCH